MIKVPWNIEEAVALLDIYIKNGSKPNVPKKQLEQLSLIYCNRAKILGLNVDDKFRNLAGLKLQLQCIHYIVTGCGMSHGNKLFDEAYKLYQEEPTRFQAILCEFYQKYCV